MDDYRIELATADDAAEIYRIMKEVYKKLEDRTLFVCSSYDYIKRQIAGEGFALKTLDKDGKMAGCFVFRYPGDAPDNLGKDIGLPESELSKVVHVETAFVLEEHRGHGLQKKMLLQAESMIDRDKYRYLLTTIAPNNIPSKMVHIKNGYEVVATKEKYNGVMRDILRKDLY